MTTGRINQVAPSRATAVGRHRGAPPFAAARCSPGHWDRGGSGGSIGGTAPGGRATAASFLRPLPGEGARARVAGDRGRRGGTAPAPRPIKGGIESESAPGDPAARRRGRARWVPTGATAFGGGRGPGNTAAGTGARGPRRPAVTERWYRPGRCSRSGAGIGTQATCLAPASGADGGPNEGAASRRSDAARRRARRGQPVRDHSRADTVTRRARLTALPQRPASNPPRGEDDGRRRGSEPRRGAKAPPSTFMREHITPRSRAWGRAKPRSLAERERGRAHDNDHGTGRPHLRA